MPSRWPADTAASCVVQVAEKLLQNINRAHQSENVLQQIFVSSSTNSAKEMQDPLGMGTFDVANLRLVRAVEDPESTSGCLD